ncbi:Putative calcium/proton exchanger, sodium/calcium exchanger membrane region [Septoria linicola]|uniref:Calcium/proton exchanger, sodium/calcium exchanger membrane region n=1 Tax=Septoria linicola TaxID=215465 RepID=A0A9Q9B185_9PEZI|nr:Putative calcium/proton exchanger, sodium/calcium exchanger membrane region [Septoria linicola]
MWRADKIKHNARKHAWYNDPGEETKTYNPFQRMNRPIRTGVDEENGLRQIRSAPESSPIDAHGKSIDAGLAQHPHHHNTFPQDDGYAGQSRGGVESFENSRESEKAHSGQTDTVQSSTIAESAGPSSTDGKPRKRKLRAFLPFGKRKDEQDEELSRSSTEKSSKTKKKRPKLSFMSQFKAVFGSWINILLIFVPIGIALRYALDLNVYNDAVVIFVINFVAIIPLAALLSFATEELAMYIGEVLGGLLNATFGNAVELIVSIIALIQGKVLIVQTSLIGSMLSNLLLVLGMCFFLGGINRPEQHFNITVAQTAASLLALAIGSLIIPTAFQIFADVDTGVTPTSRGTSVLLLVVYGCYLLFQLKTHVDMYNEPSKKTPKRSSGKKDAGDANKAMAFVGAAPGAASAGGRVNQENLVHDADEEEETPSLSILGALITLAISTVFIALCAEYMVSAITEVGQKVSQEFIGLILLPIVGNAAEHATAVTVAIKDKMDLSIGVAVGSSLQIALLVLPVMVLLSWFGVGQSVIVDGAPAVLNLDFDGFLVVILVLSIWLVNYLINDGKSHWLEGVLLMITYLIIAISAWFYPAKGEVAG